MKTVLLILMLWLHGILIGYIGGRQDERNLEIKRYYDSWKTK